MLNQVKERVKALLNYSLCHYLQAVPATSQALVKLSPKIIAIEITQVHTFYFIIDQTLRLASVPINQAIDLQLSGSLGNFMRFLIDPLSNSGLKIWGEAYLAQELRTLLSNHRVDWEYYLSRYTGDIGSYLVFKGFRKMLQWQKELGHMTQYAWTAYLQDELRVLVNHEELVQFYEQIDALRFAADRLVARINQC